MAHSFDVPTPADFPATLQRARRLIEEAGGTLSGDTSAGNFSGSTPLGAIKGKYTINGVYTTVTITEKPFLVPANKIEREIKHYFGA
jgi:hypothetical protein